MPDNTLAALIKALQLITVLRPVLTAAIDNEAERQGLSRDELHALTKRLTAETAAIATADMGEEE